jgi:hypothetical protein
MSWQPSVARPVPLGVPPSGNSTGSAITDAAAGFASGTSTTEILSCGGWQSGKAAFGL